MILGQEAYLPMYLLLCGDTLHFVYCHDTLSFDTELYLLPRHFYYFLDSSLCNEMPLFLYRHDSSFITKTLRVNRRGILSIDPAFCPFTRHFVYWHGILSIDTAFLILPIASIDIIKIDYWLDRILTIYLRWYNRLSIATTLFCLLSF